MALEITRLENHPIDSNCYIIFDKTRSNECVIVDPGSDNNVVLYEKINELYLSPQYIILTHEHFDHCWGVNALREKYSSIKLVCSSICSEAIQNARLNYSHYFCRPEFVIAPAEIILDDYDWLILWNGYSLAFTTAKGHSNSGVFFSVEHALFTGDTLIKDTKTITKFKSGSQIELLKSIDFLMKHRGAGYVIYPGHGEIFLLDEYDFSRSYSFLI